MTDEDTARLALPLLAAGQAQKETWHNEALALLDIAVQATAQEVERNAPPDAPTTGMCWIVGSAPTGDWTGHAGAIAGWTAGGWRFVAPSAGFRVWHPASGQDVIYDGATWRRGEVRAARVLVDGQQVLGPRGAAIMMPIGGSTIDSEIRSCVGTILNTLRDHGLIAS